MEKLTGTPTPVLVVGAGTVVIYVERPWVPLPAAHTAGFL